MWADVLARFEKKAPASVMAKLALEQAIAPEWVDQVFEEHRQRQYSRELLFSTTAFFKVVVASTIQLCGLLHVLLFSIRVQQHGTNRLPVASAS